ncbi:hypothetical protein PENSTE_c010G02769 [Penicillium steckii]|uniref:Uncharacterized protein n=1 Tax=Penicillium steckii TaxID=303698 RepID=A0A1V6T9C5_9EURO|nr:hypothetical protein PENSTE_c010G02769 [Penicillium steckii]
MLYNQFSPQTHNDEKYRSIQEFYLNPDSCEGHGKLKFSTETRGSFTHNPYGIDVLFHFASLTLHVNSSGRSNEMDIQYILEGWESLRIAKELSAAQSYSIYVLRSGDVYLFEGEDIVASCFGISFREISQLQPAFSSKSQSLKADYESTSSGLRTPDSTEKCNLQHEEVLAGGPSQGGKSPPQHFTITENKDLEQRALGIISQEISVNLAELEENPAFSDLGVDSLLSMSILDKINRDTGAHLAASVFVSYSTVSSFRNHLRNDIMAR